MNLQLHFYHWMDSPFVRDFLHMDTFDQRDQIVNCEPRTLSDERDRLLYNLA